MHNSKQVQRKPMVFKSMSSNFLRHALHLMGHIEIYHVVSFYHESMVIKKPMIQFIKIIQQGELSWPTASQKNHCCVYRRFLGSFLSAKVLGGLDARAENFPGLSKSARELPRGEGRTLSRSGKKFTEAKDKSNQRPRHFFPCRTSITPANLPEAAALSRASPAGRYASLDKAAVLPA